MRRLTVTLVAALALALGAAAPAGAADPQYRDGPEGRSLLGGQWLHRDSETAPWAPVTIPHAWNARDDSPASMQGSVRFYRKDFRVPSRSPALKWLVRFESVNLRAEVWLNGRLIGRHAGPFLPFELGLDGVRRGGVNRLVVRVDSRRRDTDFPPGSMTTDGVPRGGWWNAGGLLREVYLRPVRRVDLEEVTATTTASTVNVRARVRNHTRVARSVGVTGRFGDQRFRLGTVALPARGAAVVSRRLVVRRPRLWSPSSPYLYPVSVRAGTARWSLRTGLRTVKVSNGRLYLNGRATRLRGVGYHEDTRERGMAITNRDRAWLMDEAQALGATMMRTHYPPGQYLQELADREGMLLWSEVPVYQMPGNVLDNPSVRASAVDLVQRNIDVNGSHPSILTWSIGNELGAQVSPGQGAYIAAAARAAHRRDRTRPVSLATNGYASALCQKRYQPLDLLGFNEYYGWYPGPDGLMFDRDALSEFLDRARACYPRQAIMVSEFGAEANRDGPAEEKGTFTFQRDFVNFHLGVMDSKPWLSGALYWALNEFRVRPNWEGGNPRPSPPVHQKGLLTYDQARKPAWEDVRRAFGAAGLYP